MSRHVRVVLNTEIDRQCAEDPFLRSRYRDLGRAEHFGWTAGPELSHVDELKAFLRRFCFHQDGSLNGGFEAGWHIFAHVVTARLIPGVSFANDFAGFADRLGELWKARAKWPQFEEMLDGELTTDG